MSTFSIMPQRRRLLRTLPSLIVSALVFFTLCMPPSRVHAYQRDEAMKKLRTPEPAYGLWPPVRHATNGTTSVSVDPCALMAGYSNPAKAPGVDMAVGIYTPIISTQPCPASKLTKAAGSSPQLVVSAKNATVAVYLDMDESYTLTIDASTISLEANTYVGLLRGLETLSQLIVASPSPHIPDCPWAITDSPSFKHRGLLVDTARNYLSMSALMKVIDGLMYSKMSVLHWHITDSQSFPMVFPSHPELAQYGAYSAEETYTPADVAKLLAYGAQHGVRVVPETDSPGHARAWGLAPENEGTTACGDVNGSSWTCCCAEPPCGQLNPASDRMYDVLRDVIGDVGSMFADDFIHLGFDEVNYECWARDPSIAAYIKAHDITLQQLLSEFFVKEQGFVPTNRRAVYWEEAYAQGLPLRSTDIIQFWNDRNLLAGALANTTSDVLVSWADSFYLDCGLASPWDPEFVSSWCGGFHAWNTLYGVDILKDISAKDAPRVLGGECAMWGEVVDDDNFENKVWPRTTAFGGRLWSNDQVLPDVEALQRLTLAVYRLQARNISASRVSLTFCELNPDMCYSS